MKGLVELFVTVLLVAWSSLILWITYQIWDKGYFLAVEPSKLIINLELALMIGLTVLASIMLIRRIKQGLKGRSINK